jgi:hypothetical protein
VTNALNRAQSIRAMRLVMGGGIFTIRQPQTLPLAIGVGETISIVVEANALAPDREYSDTLELVLECTTYKIPLHSSNSETACLYVGDLQFGTLTIGEARTLPLRICNNGGSEVRFGDGQGTVIEWLSLNFSVDPSDIAMLRNVVLRSGDCVTIQVTFVASAIGQFSTIARFHANTRNCRDSSLWNAIVLPPSSASSEQLARTGLSANEPNPFITMIDIPYTLGRGGNVSIVVYDARGIRVATLVDGQRHAGAHVVRFDATALPAGVYYCRLSVDAWSETKTIVKRE